MFACWLLIALMSTDRQTDKNIDRVTDRQTDRHGKIQTDRQTDRLTYRQYLSLAKTGLFHDCNALQCIALTDCLALFMIANIWNQGFNVEILKFNFCWVKTNRVLDLRHFIECRREENLKSSLGKPFFCHKKNHDSIICRQVLVRPSKCQLHHFQRWC